MKSTLGGPHLRTLVLQFGALGNAGIPSAILSIPSARLVIELNPALSSILPKTSKPSFDISGTKYSPLKEPELPKFVTAKGDASFSKTGAGKGAIRIQKGATRSDINIQRAGQKLQKNLVQRKDL